MLALRNFYQKIGLRFYRFRYWLLAFTLVSAAASILLIFADVAISQRFLLSGLVATLWLLFSVSLAYSAAAAPPQTKPNGCLPAVVWFFRTALSYGLTFLFLLITLALLYFSAAAARIILTY